MFSTFMKSFRVDKIPSKFVTPSGLGTIQINNAPFPVKFSIGQYDLQSDFCYCVKLKDTNTFRLFLDKSGNLIGQHSHLFRPTLLFDYEQLIQFNNESGTLIPSLKPTLDNLLTFLTRHFNVRMYMPRNFYHHPAMKEILIPLPVDVVAVRDTDPNLINIAEIIHDRKHIVDDIIMVIDLYQSYLAFFEKVHDIWLFQNPSGESIKVIATNYYENEFRNKLFLL